MTHLSWSVTYQCSRAQCAPPPLSDMFDFLNFRLIWKMLTPPFGSILDFFEFQTLFYIAPRVTYGPQIWNLDFFEKFRPPPSVFTSPNLNFRLICFFFDPPPYFGQSPKFSRFLIMRSPLRKMGEKEGQDARTTPSLILILIHSLHTD